MRRKNINDLLIAVWPRLWRFAFGLCQNRADADDLAQATFERALQYAKRFRAGSHFDRWVFTLCRNLWYNEARARKVRCGNGVVLLDEIELPTPDTGSEANIFAAEVLKQVMTLPDTQRETLLLVYVEGFSYKEVAAILDIPVGTIMSRLAAARKKLAPLNKDDQA